MKKDLYKKHPKYIIDKQFEFLSKIQDNFVIVVVFEKEKLKKLLSVFKEVDI
ncbi:MAG: hypothetical protein LBD88_02485 [Candidatus Peribacteria bacterium]|jgi:hypothetical protein|nr:hypothetical protein [Candidatus Peribacteria bacterium]